MNVCTIQGRCGKVVEIFRRRHVMYEACKNLDGEVGVLGRQIIRLKDTCSFFTQGCQGQVRL